MEEAKRLLERTETPIEPIWWAIGDEEVASFGRLFKRMTSLTPSEYRRQFPAPGAACRT